jgi:hypothetical protein
MRILIPVFLVFLVAGCQKTGVPVNLQREIDSVSVKWVPDSREGIFNARLSAPVKNEILIKGETNIPEAKAEVITLLEKSGISFTDSLKVLPDTNEIKKTWAIVSISVCNIKKTPSHSSELVSQAIMGTPLRILAVKGSWMLVQTPDSYIGWVNDSGIQDMNNHEFSLWKACDRLIYTGQSGYIYSDPERLIVLSDIVPGSIIEKTGDKNIYWQLKLADGRKGLVRKVDAVDFKLWSAKTFPEADRMISFARSLIGSPYLWGGTSAKALDCSGFTKTIYFMNGVILSRDASLQFLHGKMVDISKPDSLAPGDLIFFGYMKKGEKRITHVGMYIGNTEVIHCSGFVRINSIDSTRTNFSSYLKETLMGAKRFICTGGEKGNQRIADHNWYF